MNPSIAGLVTVAMVVQAGHVTLPAERDLMLDRLGRQGSRRCLLPVAP